MAQPTEHALSKLTFARREIIVKLAFERDFDVAPTKITLKAAFEREFDVAQTIYKFVMSKYLKAVQINVSVSCRGL